MTDQVTPTGGPTRPASGPAEEGPPHQFGLPAAMALIVGTIIGVGIFNLPTSLAFYGPITLISVALTTVGALVLALLFAALSRRQPAGVRERLVVLDHRVGRQRGDRGRLGPLRRALHQQGP